MFACLALCAHFASATAPFDARFETSALQEPLYVDETNPHPAAAVEPEPRLFCVSLYYADVELDALELDDSSTSVTVSDVSRERIGVQFGFGVGYARVYREEVGDFEGYGIGAGVQGGYVPDPSDGAAFLLDYDVSVDLDYLDADEVDIEMHDLALEGKIGAGVALEAFHAAAGLAGSFLTGKLKASGFSDVDVQGENLGFYVGLGYVPDDVPVKARIDLYFGDIDGVALSIGYAF